MKTIISLFDHSGEWSRPYREDGGNVHGIMGGPPCTEFAGSGARWWKDKDATDVTEKSIELVHQMLRTVELFQPEWWALENPVGRIEKLVPELKQHQQFWFNPCDFGDPYTKKTGLWGQFTPLLPMFLGGDWSVEPTEGSKMHKLYGGKSERTKELRSVTPPGFAKAFFKCNP